MKSVYSFDIFDTVLTRNVYRPQDLFLRVQGTLLHAAPAELPEELCRDYSDIRIAAEETARSQLAGREEVTLREILLVIARCFLLSDAAVATLEEMEIREELASVGPVASAALLLHDARRRGRSINYISDMYLSDEVIASMLAKVNLLEPADGLFVSGRRGRRKSTGALFREVLDELRIEPGDLLHVGDYLVSDFLVPRLKLGIKAFPIRSARSNCYEALWGERCRCLYCSSVAGASRAARAANEGRGLEGTLFKLGCNVLGPMLIGFVLWTIQRARETGIRRLYFLSRDGEIILQVASNLAVCLGIEMELRYLYVSRTAVFPALMGMGIEPSTIAWLREPTIVPTVRIVADRLKIEATTFYRKLIDAGATLDTVDAPLDDATVEEICRLLVADPILNGLLAESGHRAMENLGGYLEQEGLFDGTPSGLVDLGWHGGIQDVIHACFAERLTPYGLSGYYFGVDLAGKPDSRKEGYFVDHRADEFQRYRHLFRVLIELLCSGSHGMVRGYQHDRGGHFVPLLDKPEHPDNRERTRSVRRGCFAFVDHLDAASLTRVNYRHVRFQILAVFKKLFFFPSRSEAHALGGFFFSADQTGYGLHEVAPAFSPASALRFLTGRSYAERSSESSWFFASWIRSSLRMRLFLFPLVLFLRIWYCGPELLRFILLGCTDWLNNSINAVRIFDTGGYRGYTKVDDRNKTDCQVDPD